MLDLLEKLLLTPAVIVAFFEFAKYCVSCYTQYQELKLLVTSGKERVAVTKNSVKYESER